MSDSLITLPNSIVAEASLLGCLLLNYQLMVTVDEVSLDSLDFYDLKHQHIYGAIKSIYDIGKVSDTTTVTNFLDTQGVIDQIGGLAYLVELTESLPLSSEYAVKNYAEIIKDKSLYRRFIAMCNDNITEAYKQEQTFDDIVDTTTTSLINLSNERTVSSTVIIKDVVNEELAKLKDRIENNQTFVGTSSGFSDLDKVTAGFKPGDMIVLAARPGMGKTSFALNMATEMAKNGESILFFSLEMPREQLVNRIIASECSVNSRNFMTGKMEPDELNRLWHHIENVSQLPIFIDDSSMLSISSMRSKAKKLLALNQKPKAIFVDYLQLMKSGINDDNRVRQIEDISRGIKLFAKDFEVPIIALAQLSRKIEERSGKKVPMLSDLRDSGAIEQDADLVMFINREEMYDKEGGQKGLAEIHIQKNRHGSLGVVPMTFVAQYTKFSPIAPGSYDGFDE